MSFCFRERPAPRASAAPQLLAKISRAIPPVSAAIPARVSSGLSVAAVADAIAAVVVARTAEAVVPIAAQTVVRTEAVRPVRDSNAAPAAPVVPGMIAGTAAIPARRAARSSSAKC